MEPNLRFFTANLGAPNVAFNHLEFRMKEIRGTPPKRPRQVKNTQLNTEAGALLIESSAAQRAIEKENKRKRKQPVESSTKGRKKGKR